MPLSTKTAARPSRATATGRASSITAAWTLGRAACHKEQTLDSMLKIVRNSASTISWAGTVSALPSPQPTPLTITLASCERVPAPCITSQTGWSRRLGLQSH